MAADGKAGGEIDMIRDMLITKHHTIRTYILVLVVVITCLSCTKGNDDKIEEVQIVGQWKRDVTRSTFDNPYRMSDSIVFIAYADTPVYTFESDGALRVEGGMPGGVGSFYQRVGNNKIPFYYTNAGAVMNEWNIVNLDASTMIADDLGQYKI